MGSVSVAGNSLVESIVFNRLLGMHGRVPLAYELIYEFVIAAAVVVPFVLTLAMMCIWMERKVAGHMQSRIGPNRVGPIGLLQSMADGIKLILKEDLCPDAADSLLFRLAPYLAFAPVFAAFLAMPFGPEFTFEPRLSVGVFWVLAILSVEVMGVILAGWSSNNKWSVYGAMREACQMVSYEIPLGLSILVGVMSAGTLNLVTLGNLQSGGIHTWLVCRNPFCFAAFFIYFIASLASTKRAPFDLPESESELVAGYHTEYSGMRFAFFFFADYAAMFVVGGIQAGLFFGSWNDPLGLVGYFHQRFITNGNQIGLLIVNLVAANIFISKAMLIIFLQMWLRWTLPRPRIDQVLYACVKVLLPLSCVLLLGAAAWGLLIESRSGVPWVDYNPWKLSDWQHTPEGGALAGLVTQVILSLVIITSFTAVLGWVGYAAMNAATVKKRLTDPADIVMPGRAAHQ